MSLNKFIGIGNLTRDAEVRTVGQQQVAKMGIAMSEKFRKQDGTMGENTEFMDVELWGQAGVYPYLKKGQQIYVEGSIKTDKWTDQNGVQRSSVKVRAFSVQLLGSRPQTEQSAPSTPVAPNTQFAPQAPQYNPYAAPQQPYGYRPVAPAPPAPQADPVPPPTNMFPPQYAPAPGAPEGEDLPF